MFGLADAMARRTPLLSLASTSSVPASCSFLRAVRHQRYTCASVWICDGHAHTFRTAGHIVYFFVADKIAAIAGTIGASPFIVFLAYLAVTFAYKSEKRMIVEQVKAHLVMADIADAHGISKSLEIELMAPVRSAACSITWRCLQKWDGFMGLCAKTDSAKRRGGIWLDKFETVRSGSMLLALQQVNIARQSSGKR